MTLEAYCVKCKTKREIANPQPVYTSRGAAGTRGTCPVCGTTLFRMGVTEAHANLPKPEIVAAPKAKSAAKAKSSTKAKAAGKAKASARTTVSKTGTSGKTTTTTKAPVAAKKSAKPKTK